MDQANTTVCVTGYTGYVGQHFVNYLISCGLRPFLIGRPRTVLQNQPGAVIAQPWSDPAELAEQLSILNNPLVVNLAGHFVKDHKPNDLTDIISGNLTYPTQIFEAMVLCGAQRLVNVGTSWEYTDVGDPESLNMYATIKKSNNIVLNWYSRHYPLRAINIKLNDTYGGKDRRSKLMPLLKKHVNTGQVLQLGYKSQPMNLTYISDVVRAIFLAGQRTAALRQGTIEEAFVFGNETMTIGEIVALINALTNRALKVSYRGNAPINQHLRGIWTGGSRLPGWQPEIDLQTGIKAYLEKDEIIEHDME